jgi:tetratricopeptide (TPR) repeat protein
VLVGEPDTLRRRFEDACAAAASVEARVQRAELVARLFDEPPGRVQVGRFEVTGQLGAGGMGRVYAAHDPQLDRPVAIKVLHAGGGATRLAREARAMARINDPNVVQVFDVGKADADELFVAMELVVGGTLAEWIAGDAPRERVLPLLAQAGRGLAAAHEAGVLHRDFKPSNVLVTCDAVAKVTDFGLAGRAEVEPRPLPTRTVDDRSTLTGTVLGTPAYMAPEQRLGSSVTEAADQFAFCVTCIEALYGERPRVTDGPQALARQLERLRPADARERRIFVALARGLAWDARARWPHMRDLLRGLEAARSRRLAAVAAGTGLAVVIGVIAAVGVPGHRASPPALESVGARMAASTRIGAAEILVDAGEYEPAMRTLEEAFEIAAAAGSDREAADAAARLVFVAGHLQALPREGLRWSRHAAAHLEGLQGAELIAARHHLNVGLLVAAHGDHTVALEHFHRALALRTTVLGPDHPALAEVWGTLGNDAYERGDYAVAREHLRRALALVEAVEARDETALAMLLDDLGNADQQLGDFATAEARYERALALRQAWRPGHPHLVTSWTNLAYLAAERGDVAVAEAYYRRRIDAATAAFGADDPRVGTALADLGELLIDAGRLDEAQQLYGRALVLVQTVLGSDHDETGRCHAGLGRIHLQRGDFELAEQELRRAQASSRAASGPAHTIRAEAGSVLAKVESEL